MKIRATLWLCLILVSIIILTYRAMQGAGSVVAIVPTELVSHIHGKGVDPESVRIYIGIVNPSRHASLTLHRLLHLIILVLVRFFEKCIRIFKSRTGIM